MSCKKGSLSALWPIVRKRSTKGLRTRDIQAYHTVWEFLDALRKENTKHALAISAANPDLREYFNDTIARYAAHGTNATLE